MIERNAENLPKMIDRIFAAVEPNAVFGEPIQSDGYLVITAGEVSAGGGFGSGLGFGPTRNNDMLTPADTQAEMSPAAGGGGFGGGGGSFSRPVAVIAIGPDGVKVTPIVDVSKIALSAIGAWAAILPMLLKTRQAASK